MIEELHSILDKMDTVIKDGSSVEESELITWQAALTAALKRIDRLEQAAREAIDAYLLRAAPSAAPSAPSGRTRAGARKAQLQRLANAMAELEKELDTES